MIDVPVSNILIIISGLMVTLFVRAFNSGNHCPPDDNLRKTVVNVYDSGLPCSGDAVQLTVGSTTSDCLQRNLELAFVNCKEAYM